MNTAPAVFLAIACTAALPCQLPVAKAVPASTQFVAHFEAAACAAILGQDLIETRMRVHAGKNVGDVVNRIGKTWKVYPRDILGVTIFGTSLPSGKRSLLVWTNDRLDQLLASLVQADALVYQQHDGVKLGMLAANAIGTELHLPNAARHRGKAWIYVARFGETRAVLIASMPERLLKAARVLAGNGTSLANARQPRLELPQKKGVIAYAVAEGSLKDLFSRGVTSEVASKVRGLTLTITGKDQLQVSAELRLGKEQQAEHVAAVIQGMRSLQLLRSSDTSDTPLVAENALREMSCRSKGTHVLIRTSIDVDELRDELRVQSGAKPHRKQKREHSY